MSVWTRNIPVFLQHCGLISLSRHSFFPGIFVHINKWIELHNLVFNEMMQALKNQYMVSPLEWILALCSSWSPYRSRETRSESAGEAGYRETWVIVSRDGNSVS